ncbi:Uncharacterised protein [Mycobacterium tuberculosis]|uniref:Uncharacterized protein n=2 Tax=Mycobacterium tuberculosis TaxID=1773 RepID=A0A916LBV2_MYCTX|nr:Uncharacterised protein [Mycobacterium tuberculosis]COY48945.1 Uncharacterised protein [Mycobacterium tuberculosis]
MMGPIISLTSTAAGPSKTRIWKPGMVKLFGVVATTVPVMGMSIGTLKS